MEKLKFYRRTLRIFNVFMPRYKTQTIYDMEWESFSRSGNLRNLFEELRRQIDSLENERDSLRNQLNAAQAELRNRSNRVATIAANTITAAKIAPQQSATPQVAPQPAVPDHKESEDDKDATEVRFSLLELD